VKNIYEDDPDDFIYIFEAMGPGVRITDWNECRDKVGPKKVFSKIAYRRVNFERNQQSSDRLFQFMQESQECKYGLSASKLLK